MIAVTVISPKYRKVGREAVKRFKKFTGLTPVVIPSKDGPEGFFTKLNLDRLLPKKRIVFFDSDYWLLSQLSLDEMDGNCFYGVHDPAVFNPFAFPHTDCQDFDMPKLEYFNTGFFVCDLSRPNHRAVFQRARKLKAQVDRGKLKTPTDKTDQFYLNLARLQEKVGLSRLPNSYNFYLKSATWGQQAWIPRNIVGLHGAGIPAEDKYEMLLAQAKTFGYDFYPMHAEALAWETARLVDLR